MKRITIALITIFSAAVLMVSCKEGAKKEVKIEKQEIHNHDKDMAEVAYQCPMDCEHGKTYAKEGNCPVCNMKLKKVASKSVDKDADSTKVSCKMNFKNCGKSCKDKASCKGNTDCKDKASCKGKVACKDKVSCKDKADCKGNADCKSKMASKTTCSKCDTNKSSCKGTADSSKKLCSKCQTKNCKENCKGKA
jgi:hypothetical protein